MNNNDISPIADLNTRSDAQRLGMWIFLGSLGMLFIAMMLGYLVIRLELLGEGRWLPDAAPGLPLVFLLSTFVLIGSSVTMLFATRAARHGNGHGVGMWMLVTSALAVGFLLCQSVGWVQLYEANLVFDESLYAWLIYVLTAIHALHVLGGIVPLGITTKNAMAGRYGEVMSSRRGLQSCVMYWHFLDIVWVILYIVLLWGTR